MWPCSCGRPMFGALTASVLHKTLGLCTAWCQLVGAIDKTTGFVWCIRAFQDAPFISTMHTQHPMRCSTSDAFPVWKAAAMHSGHQDNLKPANNASAVCTMRFSFFCITLLPAEGQQACTHVHSHFIMRQIA